MSTPFRLLLPRQFHAEMIEQAQAELPNECCGALAGKIEGDVARAVARYPLVNAMASPRNFESDPKSMFAAEKARRAAGLEFVAFYHSHPTSEPVPSKTDIERNWWPEATTLIISLATDVPVVRAWWLTADGYREAEMELT